MASAEELRDSLNQAHAAHMKVVHGALAECGDTLVALSEKLAACFDAGGKLLICGNGGSASDALHIAAECTGRFVKDRKALPAIALSADNSAITAIGNDYGFDRIFSRQVEAYAQSGDVLVAISTSGSSSNVVQALKVAKEYGVVTALFTGEKGRESRDADMVLAVPSGVTAHIQEAHIFLLHQLIALIERKLFRQ